MLKTHWWTWAVFCSLWHIPFSLLNSILKSLQERFKYPAQYKVKIKCWQKEKILLPYCSTIVTMHWFIALLNLVKQRIYYIVESNNFVLSCCCMCAFMIYTLPTLLFHLWWLHTSIWFNTIDLFCVFTCHIIKQMNILLCC